MVARGYLIPARLQKSYLLRRYMCIVYLCVVYSVRKFTTVRVVMVLKFYLKFRHRGMYCMTDDIFVLYK